PGAAMIVYAQCPARCGQPQLITQDVTGAGGEPPPAYHIVGPAGEYLSGPIQAIGRKAIAVLVSQVTALVIQLEGQRPIIERRCRVHTDHPVGADESALRVGQAEPAVHLGAEAEDDRVLSLLQSDQRKVFTQDDLTLVFPAEPAVAAGGGDQPSHESVHPWRGLRQFEAGDRGEKALL